MVHSNTLPYAHSSYTYSTVKVIVLQLSHVDLHTYLRLGGFRLAVRTRYIAHPVSLINIIERASLILPESHGVSAQ